MKKKFISLTFKTIIYIYISFFTTSFVYGQDDQEIISKIRFTEKKILAEILKTLTDDNFKKLGFPSSFKKYEYFEILEKGTTTYTIDKKIYTPESKINGKNYISENPLAVKNWENKENLEKNKATLSKQRFNQLRDEGKSKDILIGVLNITSVVNRVTDYDTANLISSNFLTFLIANQNDEKIGLLLTRMELSLVMDLEAFEKQYSDNYISLGNVPIEKANLYVSYFNIIGNKIQDIGDFEEQSPFLYELSLTYFKKSISIIPKNYMALANIANLNRKLKHFETALNFCNKIINIKPNDPMGYLIRGMINKETSLTEKNEQSKSQLQTLAKEDIEKALTLYENNKTLIVSSEYPNIHLLFSQALKEINPEKANLHFVQSELKRGLHYFTSSNHDNNIQKAIQTFTQIINSKNIDASFKAKAYLFRGNCFIVMKDYEKSILDYSEVIKLEPTIAESYSARAACYKELNNIPKAKEDFKKVIELETKNSMGYFGLGSVFAMEKDFDNAIINLEKAIKLKLDIQALDYAYTFLVDIYINKKDYGNLYFYTEKLIKLKEYLRNNFGLNKSMKTIVDVDEKHYTENLLAFSMIKKDSKENIEKQLIQSYFNDGINIYESKEGLSIDKKRSLASYYFNKVIELEKSKTLIKAFSYCYLGRISLDKEEDSNAVKYLTEALNIFIDSGFYYYRSLAYINLKEFQKAKDDLTKILEIEKDDKSSIRITEVNYKLGLCYFHLNDYKNAIFHFSKVIDLMPENERASKSFEYLGKINEITCDYKDKEKHEKRIKLSQENLNKILFEIKGAIENEIKKTMTTEGEENIKDIIKRIIFKYAGKYKVEQPYILTSILTDEYYKEAVNNFDQAADLAIKHSGKNFQAREKYVKRALYCFKIALHLAIFDDTKRAEIYWRLSEVYAFSLEKRYFDQALSYITQASTIDSKNSFYMYKKGSYFAFKKDYKEAQKYLEKVNQMDPSYMFAIFVLAQIDIERGDIAKGKVNLIQILMESNLTPLKVKALEILQTLD